MRHPDEPKYILQHLANERTYLNWIRATMGVVGVFFVILRFYLGHLPFIHHGALRYVKALGLIVLAFCLFAAFYAPWNYMRKRADINHDPHHASKSIVALGISVVFILIVVAAYLLFFE